MSVVLVVCRRAAGLRAFGGGLRGAIRRRAVRIPYASHNMIPGGTSALTDRWSQVRVRGDWWPGL